MRLRPMAILAAMRAELAQRPVLWVLVILSSVANSGDILLRHLNDTEHRAIAYSCGFNDASRQKLSPSAGRFICDDDRAAAQRFGFVVVQGGRGI